MRPRIVLFSLAAIIIVFLIVLGLADELLVDLLWFGVLGYRSVFLTQLGAQITIFAARVVRHLRRDMRQRLRRARPEPGARAAPYRAPLRRDDRGQPARADSSARRPYSWRLLVAGGRGFARAVRGFGRSRRRGTSTSRDFTRAPFARTDPAFGKNLGFYVFALPLLEDWRDLFMLILFLTAAVTGDNLLGARRAGFPRVTPAHLPGRRRAFLGAVRGLLRAARDELLAGALRTAAA